MSGKALAGPPETMRLLDIQIFTAVRRDPAQAGHRQKHGILGNSDGKRPDEPTHRHRSGSSIPNDKRRSWIHNQLNFEFAFNRRGYRMSRYAESITGTGQDLPATDSDNASRILAFNRNTG